MKTNLHWLSFPKTAGSFAVLRASWLVLALEARGPWLEIVPCPAENTYIFQRGTIIGQPSVWKANIADKH